MSSQMLYRASGLALMIGSLLAIICANLGLMVFQFLTPPWLVVTLGWNIGIVLLLLGLPGVVARQAFRAGWLGFVGGLLMFLGTFLLAGYIAMGNLTISTWLIVNAPQVGGQLSATDTALYIYNYLEVALLMLGGLLLGIATVRARVLPRWGGVLLIVGAVLTPAGFMSPLIGNLSGVLLTLGQGVVGYGLWRTKSEVLPEPEPLATATTQGVVAPNM